MANAINKVKLKLQGLALRNSNANYLNKDLYRMLYEEELYIMAYETIKRNGGIMTRGTAWHNIDGVNMAKVKAIISKLRDGSFKPRPCRRSYIKKPNGKLRPLGLPDYEEKLIQQCVSRILECIYDSPRQPTFSDKSHGFRKGRCCHSALKQMHETFRTPTWIIKADIKGFFDNVDHHVLISLLRKRIKDERFIQLIWKFLRAGYVEDGKFVKTMKGTPQGGVASPILSNIYLHEFDEFVEKLTSNNETKMVSSKKYRMIQSRAYQARKMAKKSERYSERWKYYMEKNNKWRKIQMELPSKEPQNPNGFIIQYVRYADDWVIGIKGTYQQAKLVFTESQKFFKEELCLEWNTTKSKLVKSNEELHEFLGVHLQFCKSTRSVRKKFVKYGDAKSALQRVTTKNTLRFKLPKQKVLSKLKAKGYLNKAWKPAHKGNLQNLDDYGIALHYQSVIRGIENYYLFVDNIEALRHVHYLLAMSFVCTLCRKYQCRRTKIFKKLGKELTVHRQDGKKSVSILTSSPLRRDVRNFKTGVQLEDWGRIFFKGRSDTASWLREKNCCICTSTDRIQMHHVKHIKRRGVKYVGFDKLMGRINRKQIPVCHKCHVSIHNGSYDGLDLKRLADEVSVRLGIVKYKE